MRKKSGLTIVEQAIVFVPEFGNVVCNTGGVCLLLNKKCPKVLSQPKNGSTPRSPQKSAKYQRTSVQLFIKPQQKKRR